MKTLAQVAWATFERGMARLAPAVVMLFFARYSYPEAVGLYNWVALAYTLYHAVAEIALRSQAALCLRNPSDLAYLKEAAGRSQLVGVIGIGSTLAVLGVVYPTHRDIVVGLIPFCAVPFLTTRHIVPTALLQYHERWKSLARCQTFAAVLALAVSLPVTFLNHSSLAMSVNIILTEGLYLAFTMRAARSLQAPQDLPSRNPGPETRRMILVSCLSWSQNQLERVLIGALAGPKVLGLYTTSSTIGRSAGDSLGGAMSNFVLARSAALNSWSARQAMVLRIGLLGVAAAALLTVVVSVLTEFVLAPFLGPSYAPTLLAAPLFALATIPGSVSVSLQMFGVSQGRSPASIASTVAGILAALPIAYLATQSLILAALGVVAKEIVVLVVCAWLLRARNVWLLTAAATGTVALGGALMYAL